MSENRAERFARDREPAVSKCLFVQLCAAINRRPVKVLQHQLDDKGRLFYVSFRGDEGTDWGGIYRETLARATSDLFAPYFALNVPCPNRVLGQVERRDQGLVGALRPRGHGGAAPAAAVLERHADAELERRRRRR